MISKKTIFSIMLALSFTHPLCAGPYTEIGINGYIGDDWRHASVSDSDAVINPIFRGWADGVDEYKPSDDDWFGFGVWDDPNKALGPAIGDVGDIVSLGDLNSVEIADSCSPGYVTMTFGDSCDPFDANHIRDGNGYDFAVFENPLIAINTDPFHGTVTGDAFAELGFVEVSSNGVDFARFPAVSLTSGPVNPGGTVDISNLFYFAGKQPNGYGWCIGTAFDLSDIAGDPNVISGAVDINNISYVRIVDVPGSGDFQDQAKDACYTDPNSRPNWNCYNENHPVYDGWPTEGSGGFDLEAIGVLKEQNFSADINLDGIVDDYDLMIFMSTWLKQFGQTGWIERCDLVDDGNLIIDWADISEFTAQWRKVESWRSQ